MSEAFLNEIREALGPKGVLTDDADVAPHVRDWLDRFGERPLAVVRPASAQECVSLVTHAAAHGIAITAQGGNTGLLGASVAGAGPAVIASLSRMNRIVEVDPVGFTVTVEAGATLSAVHEAVAEHGLALPLHLGSEGTAQIGGLIATNAGGSHAMRFGMMQDQVLGLDAVLADGRLYEGSRALIKDNAGYHLARLLCGSEGTLALVTTAVLRLEPALAHTATALLTAPSLEVLERAAATLRRDLGLLLTALEFFSETGLRLLEAHLEGISRPVETKGPLYCLVEIASAAPLELGDILEGAMAKALEEGAFTDGAVASSEAQRAEFWRLREEMPEGQRLEGRQLKHDVAVPVGRLAAFVETASARAQGILPGVRINAFGHLGDGNVHFNLSPPEGEHDFGAASEALTEAIYAAAVEDGGTFAAEHGLGQAKVAMADRLRPAVERDLMRAIKRAFDPEGRFNPGKVV